MISQAKTVLAGGILPREGGHADTPGPMAASIPIRVIPSLAPISLHPFKLLSIFLLVSLIFSTSVSAFCSVCDLTPPSSVSSFCDDDDFSPLASFTKNGHVRAVKPVTPQCETPLLTPATSGAVEPSLHYPGEKSIVFDSTSCFCCISRAPPLHSFLFA